MVVWVIRVPQVKDPRYGRLGRPRYGACDKLRPLIRLEWKFAHRYFVFFPAAQKIKCARQCDWVEALS